MGEGSPLPEPARPRRPVEGPELLLLLLLPTSDASRRFALMLPVDGAKSGLVCELMLLLLRAEGSPSTLMLSRDFTECISLRTSERANQRASERAPEGRGDTERRAGGRYAS